MCFDFFDFDSHIYATIYTYRKKWDNWEKDSERQG